MLIKMIGKFMALVSLVLHFKLMGCERCLQNIKSFI